MEASLSDLYRLDEREHSTSDNSGDNSPSTTNFASINSPKRSSRRAIQKKVVNIPLKDLEGSKFKGECTPPSDSWAWRKYGQKPIKGSPYPRGYYRCSSSKGCPARKQVERSRLDPSMLVVTYSYDHNHPWPTSRTPHQNRANSNPNTTTTTTAASTGLSNEAGIRFANNTPVINTTPSIINHPNNNQLQTVQFQLNVNNSATTMAADHHLHQPLMIPPIDELTWLSSDNNNEIVLQNDFLFNNGNFTDLDMARFFPMREEDESLFADLGELPECSVVFRRAAAAVAAAAGGEEQHQKQCKLAPWCGPTAG